MTIFDRYIFRQASSALLLILFSLLGVVWIAMALKQLKLVTTKGQDVVTLLTMTTLAIPNLLAIIGPVALLIAAIHTLNRLNSDSELIVLSASGANIWRVARPLLYLALIVSICAAIVGQLVMPWSLRTLRSKLVELRSDLITQVLQPGRFSSPMDGIMVHIRERARDGTLLGVVISDTRKPDAQLTYLAEFGRIIRTRKTSFLAMEKGHVLRKEIAGKTQNQAPEILEFDSYAVDLEQFERKVGPPRYRPRELYLGELIERISAPPTIAPSPKRAARPAKVGKAKGQGRGRKKNRKRKSRNETGQYTAELHERFSSPLYPFVFVLFAVAFIGRAQSTRTNQTRAMAFGFAASALCRLAGMAAGNATALNPSLAPLLYVVPIAGAGVAVAMMILQARPKRPSRIALAIEAFVDRLTDRAAALFTRRPRVQAGE